MSGPKLLDAALWTTQHPVDVAAVDVGGDLRRDHGGQARGRLGQGTFHPEDALLENRQTHLHLLAERWATVRLLGGQQHPALGRFLPEHPAAVGQVSQKPPGDGVPIETGSPPKSSRTKSTSATLAALSS
jgi:hypothetical protein